MRVLLLLTILVAGCGPSAQERYNTALSILEKERAALKNAEQYRDDAERMAKADTYREVYGESPMSEKIQQMYLESSLTEEHRQKQQDRIDKQHDREFDLDVKLINESSKEFGIYDRHRKQLPGYQRYQDQLKRFERAKQMVKDAEAAL